MFIVDSPGRLVGYIHCRTVTAACMWTRRYFRRLQPPRVTGRACAAQSAAAEARIFGSGGLLPSDTPLEACPKPAGGQVVYLSERRTSRMPPAYATKDL